MQVVCLDEADEMLKMGFKEDVEEILRFIKARTRHSVQTLLFSATIPDWVMKLSQQYLKPDKIVVDLLHDQLLKTPKDIEHLLIEVHARNKREENQIVQQCIKKYVGGKDGRVIIFTETKRDADNFYYQLQLDMPKGILHGDIPQVDRENTFRNFKSGQVKCIIATNVAARGLDIPSVDLVIQMEPPKKSDEYVHRAGRTGRAGHKGVCITLFNYDNKWRIDQIVSEANVQFKYADLFGGEIQKKKYVEALPTNQSNAFEFDDPFNSFNAPEPKKDIIEVTATFGSLSDNEQPLGK
jgi:ATP-dependent RNA helicase DDX21